jgi:cytoskeletal protein CcmA (bactofilin family)
MAFSSSKRNGTGSYDDYGSSATGSFFGKTMNVEGEITSDGDLTIEGKVTGKLDISNTLTIGTQGHVNGDISAAVVRIGGEAEGQLVAKDKLEISAEGKYNGNIQAERIVVAEGAQVKGTVNMSESSESSETKPVEAIVFPEKEEEPVEEIEIEEPEDKAEVRLTDETELKEETGEEEKESTDAAQ